MRILLLFLLLVISQSFVSAQQPRYTAARVFKDSKFNFSIIIPDLYKIYPSSNPNHTVDPNRTSRFMLVHGEGPNSSISVGIAYLAPSDAVGFNLTKLSKQPDQYLQELASSGSTRGNPGKVIKKAITELDGAPALYLAREGVIRPSLDKKDTVRYSYVDYFLIKGSKIFSIEFEYRSDHGRAMPEEYSIINTFSFCPSCWTYKPKPAAVSVASTTSPDGVRKFCDGTSWVHTLKITGGIFVIKAYPSASNKYFKNKSVPNESISGRFVDGKLLSKLRTGEDFELYKLKGNSLYRYYDETGDYSEFLGCK